MAKVALATCALDRMNLLRCSRQILANQSATAMRSWGAMFRIRCRRHRMSSAVEFRTDAEKKTRGDKNEDPLLFGCEHNSAQVLRLSGRPAEEKPFVRRNRYFPSGVVTSVPVGGVNSKVADGMGARVWLE